MKVLVTGGAGFIGTAVAARLTAAGHEPLIFDRAVNNRDELTDLDRVKAAAAECDRIIHLAAKVGLGVSLSDLDGYAQDNDLGTAVLLRAAAECEIEQVVLASSMVVYGEGRASCPTHGDQPVPARTRTDLEQRRFEPRCPRCGSDLMPELVAETTPLDPRNVYAATKMHTEQLAAVWARETDSRAIALRYHNVYGPGLPRDTPYAGVAALFRSALARQQSPTVFEDGNQRRDFVHVDDVATATVAAAETVLESGFVALNVGSGTVTTIGEVATAMARIMAGPEPVVTGAYRLGDVRHITADSSAARRLLDWCPEVDLTHGLESLVREC